MSTYEPIASQTLGSTSANVTFSSIPQGYTDLVLVVQAKAATTDDNIYLRFNSDSGSNYSVTNMYGNGSTAASTRYSNNSFIWFDNFGYLRTSSFSTIIMNFQNYSNSTTNKTCLIRNNIDSVGVTASVGLWRNTAPITAINLLTSGFASGSTFSLYGIQVGNAAQKAQGGNIVTSDGTYVYHTFTSSGAFIPSQALTVDYLIVAGGGSGASQNAGGGGAGGLRTFTSQSLSATAYTVTIGAGGAAANTATGSNGNSGSNSSFNSTSATGGGFGSISPSTGASGGSGGGGGSVLSGGSGNAGSYSPVEGYAGGSGALSYHGGGGGGAGGVGSNATAYTKGGNGGIGATSSLINAMGSATNTGQLSGGNYYYAGGGAGGTGYESPSVFGLATGGLGGGGNGGIYNNNTNPTAGAPNTGGGGGGQPYGTQPTVSGGSGIVIIRYLA